MKDGVAPALPEWLAVSSDTKARLVAFAALVEKWNPAINLVSKTSMQTLWERHILDSAQLFVFASRDRRVWVDMGSGAGFPGLIIAILAAEVHPDLKVILIEADQRKASFLDQVIRTLELTTVLHRGRVETVGPFVADIVSARALAPLDRLCGLAIRHLADNGIAVFPKGAQADDELAVAQKRWKFTLTRHRSRTDASATILELKDITYV